MHVYDAGASPLNEPVHSLASIESKFAKSLEFIEQQFAEREEEGTREAQWRAHRDILSLSFTHTHTHTHV